MINSLHRIYTGKISKIEELNVNSENCREAKRQKKTPIFTGLLVFSSMISRGLNGTLERIRTSDLPLRRHRTTLSNLLLNQILTHQAFSHTQVLHRESHNTTRKNKHLSRNSENTPKEFYDTSMSVLAGILLVQYVPASLWRLE